VETTVGQVEPDSPAQAAGVREDDRIDQVRLRTRGANGPEWKPWFKRQATRRPCEQWAPFFWAIQRSDYHEIEIRVFRDGKLREESMRLVAQPDRTWPLVDRGFQLTIDTRLQKTNSLIEALGWGVRETVSFIKQIYLSLSSLISGRIALDNLESPIGIVSRAYDLASDLPRLMLFLGALSINLAVVNFLPIPVLDGGHMVMLLYEKLRGKPMPESVMGAATYVGLALLAALMIFVVCQDISKWDLINRIFGRP
jgi:regulator of sigma E protease